MRVFVFLALAGMVASCTPRLRIEWSRPARVQIPAGTRLALEVVPDGVPPAGVVIAGVALDALRGQVLNKWLAVEPVRHALGREIARLGLAQAAPAGADLVVRACATNWQYTLHDRGAQGKVGAGRLDVRIEFVSVKDPKAPPVHADSYWASSELAGKAELDVMLRAAETLAARFASDLRPVRVSRQVVLDDSDPVTETGIALCRGGKWEAAQDAFADAVARAPNSAPALYDLAVMKEIWADYAEAESLVLRANKIAPKALYYDGLARIRAARRDAEAFDKKP